MHLSFVRSISMDKWKDTELEKMKVGGNKKAKEFFNEQRTHSSSFLADSWSAMICYRSSSTTAVDNRLYLITFDSKQQNAFSDCKPSLFNTADWDWKSPISERYNTKAAALYRDRIATEAQGKEWSIETSSAKNYVSRVIPSRNLSAGRPAGATSNKNAASTRPKEPIAEKDWGAGSYQDYNQEEISKNKDQFFDRITNENSGRPE